MITDEQIAHALIGQVNSIAGENHCSERDVTTYISRPMWEAWSRFTKTEGEPTEWLGLHETRRVYGSETIVVESPELFAVSRKER